MKKRVEVAELLNLFGKSAVTMKRLLGFNAVATIEKGTRKYSYDFGNEEYSFFAKTVN